MEGALVILAAMVVVGLLLYVTDKKYFRHHHSARDNNRDGVQSVPQQEETTPEVCCGQHLICEKTSLQIIDNEIIYYDDEELDRFQGRTPDSYTLEETEEFRDVLMTLLPEDVAGWARSISLRNIKLPDEVKDELMILVTDLRASS